MSDITEEILSPNELLAVQIANALLDAGLIKDGNKSELLSKLKAGGVSQDDWNLWIDIATSHCDSNEEVQ